jgi:hypothetical protein
LIGEIDREAPIPSRGTANRIIGRQSKRSSKFDVKILVATANADCLVRLHVFGGVLERDD